MYQYQSAAEKRRDKRRAFETLYRMYELLSKIQKLEQFFGKKSSGAAFASEILTSFQSYPVPDLSVDDVKASNVTNVSRDNIEQFNIP